LFTASLDGRYQVTHIQYEYDPLHRLVRADYDGDFNGEYRYAYDAVGNRTTYTTTITNTTVIAYSYDAANRLLESREAGGEVTVYQWDDAGRLLGTAVDSINGRTYTYDQRGNLTSALVDNLLTTFLYDGDGHRLQMSVGGEVTTYTLDYAGGFRVLLEEGGAFAKTKHYLYGLECIGELVDADEPESEWRYYHQDGNHLVRQTTNIQATVTLAWTYSPEGAIVLGEEGPVTHLGCNGNTTYDFSTGLIFKNGRYFDPNTGIWLTMTGMVVWNGWQTSVNHRNKKRQRSKRLFLLLLLFLVIITLAGCGGNTPAGTPIPDPTETCTPTSTPTATLPPPVITNPTLTPSTTPLPTTTPIYTTVPPTNTPMPTNTPYPVPPNLSAPTISVFGTDTAIKGEDGFDYNPGIHNGRDVIPSRFYGNNDAVIGAPVYALYAGYLIPDADGHRSYLRIGASASTWNSVDYELMYSHIDQTRAAGEVKLGDEIGKIMDITFELEQYKRGDFNHLHLEIRQRANKAVSFNPEFLLHPVGG
jgi:YD repeat-containing protein